MSKTHIDSAAVRQLATLLDDTGLQEIEYETEALRIRISKGTATAVTTPPPLPPHHPVESLSTRAALTPADTLNTPHPGTIKAPMVGVVYLSPEPEANDFVTVGQEVREGETLMLIEAMKTFNPIKAPRSGRLTSILVTNEQPVEYGDALVIIE